MAGETSGSISQAGDDGVVKFRPPNISAFKQREIGEQGSLFNMKNIKHQTAREAELVETRVKKLQMEEERMLKKIEQTRMQADKMQRMHDESNEKYM